MTRKALLAMLLTLLIVAPPVLAFYGQEIDASSNSSSQVQGENLNCFEQRVVQLVNGSRAYDYDLELERLAFQHHAFRVGGSLGANETANWIKEQFENFGLEAWLEPFEFTNWTLLSKPSLLIDDDGDQSTTDDQITIDSFQSTHYSWPTPEEGVFADLVVLPLPEAENPGETREKQINMTAWNAINTTGKVVLIGKEVRSWEQTYETKLSEETPAAIVYTWWYDWMAFTPPMFSSVGGRPISFDFGPYYWDLGIPVGFVSYEDGLRIRNRENTVNVSAHFSIRSVINTGTHYNVVGKIKGYKNPEKTIIISGHYDTVMCGGFCDNGAGMAGVIELAKVLAEAVEKGFYRPSHTLLFIAFASEELGLVGSVNYVKQHKSEMTNIFAVVNLDCVGSDDLYVTETNPVNGFDLDEIMINAAQDLGITATLEQPGGSDQGSFQNPSMANALYSLIWGLEAGISDATPVESSAMLVSYPLMYADLWYIGTPGWIHTSYDNSTSTETLDWVEVEDLEDHIKVVALTIIRISRVIIGTVYIHPETLNLKSKGEWITGYIEFPECYDANDIDVSSILLNGTIPAEIHPIRVGDEDGNGVPDLMAKFDRAEVVSYILAKVDTTELIKKRFTNVTLTIAGELGDGTPFKGSDTIRIIMPLPKKMRAFQFVTIA